MQLKTTSLIIIHDYTQLYGSVNILYLSSVLHLQSFVLSSVHRVIYTKMHNSIIVPDLL